LALELALFDLDDTLLPIDSDHAFGEYLAQRALVDPVAHRAENERFYQQYLAGKLEILKYQQFILAPLKGLSPAELEELHQGFMADKILPAIRPEARALIETHQSQGDLCAIVTATNSYITAPIARAFGVEHLLATVAVLQDGRITGDATGVPCYREGKVTRVHTWLESMALSLPHMRRSTFYSDSHNDLPLLLAVSHPVATNPDKKLREQAEQRGWRILELFENV
jgi:HAD superfamily hydrolase (TIGR01490 family)